MKRIIVFAIAIIATTAMRAQHEEGTFNLQPKVGMNIATLSDADKYIVDLCFGLEGEYMLADRFSLAAGIIMSNQGAKYNDKTGDFTTDLDYVNVPITANFYVLPGLAIKAGVQPAFRTKAKMKSNDGTVDLDEFIRVNRKELGDDIKVSKFDIAIPVGLSYEFYNIVLDARYSWGLQKIVNAGDAFYNRGFQVTLGYKLQLN